VKTLAPRHGVRGFGKHSLRYVSSPSSTESFHKQDKIFHGQCCEPCTETSHRQPDRCFYHQGLFLALEYCARSPADPLSPAGPMVLLNSNTSIACVAGGSVARPPVLENLRCCSLYKASRPPTVMTTRFVSRRMIPSWHPACGAEQAV